MLLLTISSNSWNRKGYSLPAALAQGNDLRCVMKSNKEGMVLHMFQGSTQSLLIQRSVLSMKTWMPQVSKRNKAWVAKVVTGLPDRMENNDTVVPESVVDQRRSLAIWLGGIHHSDVWLFPTRGWRILVRHRTASSRDTHGKAKQNPTCYHLSARVIQMRKWQ